MYVSGFAALNQVFVAAPVRGGPHLLLAEIEPNELVARLRVVELPNAPRQIAFFLNGVFPLNGWIVRRTRELHEVWTVSSPSSCPRTGNGPVRMHAPIIF